MQDGSNLKAITNPVLREALARIDRDKRCAFPYWGNWGNWGNWHNWGNWGNWGNWHNWHNGWGNG
jgi:hypothetical protein